MPSFLALSRRRAPVRRPRGSISALNGSYTGGAGEFGDSDGSEWIFSNDSKSMCVSNPCPNWWTSGPPFNNDPIAEYASCAAAIEQDGGSYTLGIFGFVPLPSGTQPGVGMAGAINTSSSVINGARSTITWRAIGHGVMTKYGFRVNAGSTIPINLPPDVQAVDGNIVRALVANGTLKHVFNPNIPLYKFTKAHYFASPSQAAALIDTTLVDGWQTWKTARGETLAQLYKH